MTTLQLSFILVASIWAAVNTLIAGYNAVNGTRDRILTGCTDEGIPMSLEHRRIMFRNDWMPMKAGIALINLFFAAFLIYLPNLTVEVSQLRAVCYVAAAAPMFGFVTFFFLGISDFMVMRKTLAEAEAAESARKKRPRRRSTKKKAARK